MKSKPPNREIRAQKAAVLLCGVLWPFPLLQIFSGVMLLSLMSCLFKSEVDGREHFQFPNSAQDMQRHRPVFFPTSAGIFKHVQCS